MLLTAHYKIPCVSAVSEGCGGKGSATACAEILNEKKKELAWEGITKGNTNNTIAAARKPDLELTKNWGI